MPRGREGVPFKAMPAPARAAAHELMKASLSAVGYTKAANVIQLETVLRQIETFGLSRDPENYAFTVFGNPGRRPRPGAGASRAITSRSTSRWCPASRWR